MSNRVVIIGAGFAGLSASCYLAKAGYDVLVLDKNSMPGGRAQMFSAEGFTFDMGPSWYWMPDVFESFFQDFGKKPSDYYDLVRLNPSYSVYFGKDDRIDLPASFSELCKLFEQIESGSSDKLKIFLDEASYKYKVGMRDLVYKPGRSLTEFADFRLLQGMIKLQVFSSISQQVRRLFKNNKLRQILEFPVLFLGARPEKTPALYSLMNYADIKLGTWYPMGGMFKVAEGMHKLAESLGVEFKFNSEVSQLQLKDKNVKRVVLASGQEIEADMVVAGADYHFVEQNLLPKEARQYSPEYWESRTMAPSSLLYYVGLNKELKQLLHHSLFFDADFAKHAVEIYDKPGWPTDPLFYVCRTSATDNSVAPEGMDNLFILVPVAPGLEESQEIKDRYFDLVMNRMEDLTGENIREHVVYRRDFGPSDFVKTYNSFKGNAYGLANTLKQTAILKPAIKNKNLSNLYYTGQLTVPGPGVPPSLISGKVVAQEIQKEHKLN